MVHVTDPPPRPKPTVVVMGVTGSGKTSVGRRVAAALEVAFVDADDFHSSAAIAKMRAGVPLDDGDRAPWLAHLNQVLREHHDGVVLAASALTAAMRAQLTNGVVGVRFVALTGDPATIARRLAARVDHFAGAALLPSQLALLDVPPGAVVLDIEDDVEVLVARAVAALRSGG
jgi:gluconokinase